MPGLREWPFIGGWRGGWVEILKGLNIFQILEGGIEYFSDFNFKPLPYYPKNMITLYKRSGFKYIVGGEISFFLK